MTKFGILFLLFIVNYTLLFGAKSFDNHFLLIKPTASATFGLLDGNYFANEESSELSAVYSDSTVLTASPTVYPGLMWGIGAEYLINRFGICIDYQRITISEKFAIGGGNYKLYENIADLISLNNIKAGLNYYIFPFTADSIAGAYYAGISGGYLWGIFKPNAAIQDFINSNGSMFNYTVNENTTASGYNIAPKIGVVYMISYFLFDFSFSYNYNILNLGKNLSDYNLGSGTGLNFSYFAIDLTAGMAF